MYRGKASNSWHQPLQAVDIDYLPTILCSPTLFRQKDRPIAIWSFTEEKAWLYSGGITKMIVLPNLPEFLWRADQLFVDDGEWRVCGLRNVFPLLSFFYVDASLFHEHFSERHVCFIENEYGRGCLNFSAFARKWVPKERIASLDILNDWSLKKKLI